MVNIRQKINQLRVAYFTPNYQLIGLDYRRRPPTCMTGENVISSRNVSCQAFFSPAVDVLVRVGGPIATSLNFESQNCGVVSSRRTLTAPLAVCYYKQQRVLPHNYLFIYRGDYLRSGKNMCLNNVIGVSTRDYPSDRVYSPIDPYSLRGQCSYSLFV